MIKNEILQMIEIDDCDGKYGEYSGGFVPKSDSYVVPKPKLPEKSPDPQESPDEK
jgi:hypothetical protein